MLEERLSIHAWVWNEQAMTQLAANFLVEQNRMKQFFNIIHTPKHLNLCRIESSDQGEKRTKNKRA